ncbi:RloB-like protein [Rhizobium sp. RU35A]|uniref:RloB domain-containing protein n=1 Tax=Rhizobium straminoryzae TaxID=1387186 RepID=A0A549T7H5_9HYPH|nr:RloB domain-containing protein [Rhizobium straminoryzae]SIQ94994.1 RloB-like protein [Rhizobium sp. RU35A]
MSRRRSHIALRRPIYIGCEGASEVGYASFLQDLARATNLPVHLHIEELGPGTGDPLSRIELAVLRLTLMQKKRNVPAERFVLLDFDQAEREPHRAARAVKLAADNAISIVWQRPCFEAVLLRHLVGRAAHRPPDTHAAMRALEREWPHYRKPMRRSDLARLIDADAVRRAAHVEEELQALLACIGLLSEA